MDCQVPKYIASIMCKIFFNLIHIIEDQNLISPRIVMNVVLENKNPESANLGILINYDTGIFQWK